MDAARGKVDTDGERLAQWEERVKRATDELVELLGEVEYEYACQQVTEDGEGVGLTQYDWTIYRDQAETWVKQETEDNERFEKEFGKNGFTFRLVRRRKAGETIVVED
jgi:hypothetical protein